MLARSAGLHLHPSGGTGGILNWTNQTSSMAPAGSKPKTTDAGLAYDPKLGDMVLYGGLTPKATPSNATWEYDGFEWSNVTSTSGGPPPALAGMSLVWDPSWGGILLTGGELTSGVASNETWLFNSTGWHNETAAVSGAHPTADSPHDAFGAAAYDGKLQELIVVNGCVSPDSPCSDSLVGETYALGGPATTWTNLSFPGGNKFPENLSGGGYGGQMAYDPALSELVYFGGGNGSRLAGNATWALEASGGWRNVTATSRGCTSPTICTAYPAGTTYGAMTWDGGLHEVVLVGGLNDSGKRTNATWLFNGSGDWNPACAGSCALANPTAESDGEMASNSTDVAALLVDGVCAVSCAGDSWVYEVSPEPSVGSVSPNPSELGVPVKVIASNLVGTGAGPNLSGTVRDSAGQSNTTSIADFTNTTPFQYTAAFSVGTAGSYTVWAQEQDYFGVVGTSADVAVLVNSTLSAAPSAAPDPTEVGTPVSFAAGVTAGSGVPPFTYAWTFGDGNTSGSADPKEPYPSASTYTASLLITDHLSKTFPESITVTVLPKLTATAGTNIPVADSGVPVQFSGTAAGGSGTYASYHWDFGDRNSSSDQYIAHAYVTLVPRVYVAYFNVTDSDHFGATAKVSLQVNPELSLSPIHASTSTPTTSTAVRFNVTVRNGTPGYTYAWNFGDSAASTNATPTHTFRAAGTYEVSVVVEDRAGGVQRAQLIVHVSSAPSASSILGWLSHGLGLYTFAGALAAAVFLAVVLLLGRRRRRAAAAKTTEEAGAAPPTSPEPEATETVQAPPEEASEFEDDLP